MRFGFGAVPWGTGDSGPTGEAQTPSDRPSSGPGLHPLEHSAGSTIAPATTSDAALASSAPRHTVRDSGSIVIVENRAPASEVVWRIADRPETRIGDGAGPAYELFRVAGATRLDDGTVIIANSGTSEIRWYDADGRHLRTAGRSGDGPGEFRLLSRMFRVPGDSLMVVDAMQRRLSVFDAHGTLARSQLLAEILTVSGRFTDGSLLLVPGGMVLGDQGPIRTERLAFPVRILVPGESASREVAMLQGTEVVIAPTGGVRPTGEPAIGRSARPFGRATGVGVIGDHWIAADNDHPEIRFLDRAGALVRLARWPARPQSVTREHLQAHREQLLSDRDDEARRRLQSAWSRHPAPPETAPDFATPLHIDAFGSIWLQRYELPGSTGFRTYDVFSHEGIWLATATGPRTLRLQEIGDDYVVGVTRDEFDVEIVSVHPLEKG
jgi:hypothetical protein